MKRGQADETHKDKRRKITHERKKTRERRENDKRRTGKESALIGDRKDE